VDEDADDGIAFISTMITVTFVLAIQTKRVKWGKRPKMQVIRVLEEV
jgi:hypothetical protein